MTVEKAPVPQFVLDYTKPDFDSLYSQLQEEVINSDSWNALVTAGTGNTLLRFMASVGAFNQFGIARSIQETMLDTARIPSSIIRIMRMLGVHIKRRVSGNVFVSLTKTVISESLFIPKYSLFTIDSLTYFNRSPISFNADINTLEVELFQGQPVFVTAYSDGTPFQRFVVGTKEDASDEDILVTDVNGAVWTPTRTGLWELSSTSKQFYESTLPDRKIELWFGNGYNGDLLPKGNFTVQYMRVASYNDTKNTAAINADVTALGYAAEGYVTVASQPNTDAPDIDFYKIVGPSISAAKTNPVSRDGYRAKALEYPGVIDALFRGQAELNPSDLRYMNIIGATLVTAKPWNGAEFDRFAKYLENVGIATTKVIRSDPIVVPISISMSIKAHNRASLADVETRVREVLTTYFVPKIGCLGAFYHISDLVLYVMNNCVDSYGSLIDYIESVDPSEPIRLTNISYAQLEQLNITVSYTERNVNVIKATGL